MSRPSPLSETILGNLPDWEQQNKPAGLSSAILHGDEHSQALTQAVRLGAQAQPDAAARVLRMQAKTGLPGPVVERHIDEIEQQANLQDFNAEQFRTQSPAVAKWLLEDPQHAALAHDDLEQLGSVEQLLTYGANFARSLAAAVPGAGAASRRVLQAFVENIIAHTSVGKEVAPMLARGMREEAQAAESLAATVRPAGGNRIERDVYSGAESIGQMLLLMPLSALTGTAAPMLAGMGLLTGGQSYGQAREQGVTPGKAAAFAGGQAAVEVLTEMIPANTLVKEFSLHTGLGRLLWQELKQEAIGEEIATALQDLNEWAMLPENKDKPFGDYVRARPSAFADTLLSTFVAVAGTTGGVRLVDRAITGKPTEQVFFEQLAKGVTDSKTFQRMPEKVRELIAEATKDGPISTFYQPIDSWQQHWNEKGVDPRRVAEELLGKDGLAAYDEAVTTGRDMAVTAADATTKLLGNPELASFFARELRLEPESMNAREVEEFHAEDIATEEPDAQTLTLEQSAAKVREDIVGQLVGEGYSPDVIQKNAKIYEQVYKVMGSNLGVDPFELYQRRHLTIQREIPEILRSMPNLDSSLDAALDRLRSGKVPTPGEMFGVSLTEFLRSKGELRDEGGELASLEVDADRKKFQKKLVQPKGLPLDTAREIAAEAGYLPTQSSITDFLDVIEKEVRGEPVYAQGRENADAIEASTVLNQLQDYLAAVNVDVRKTSNAEIRKRLIEATEGPAGATFNQTFGEEAGKRGFIRFGIDPKTGKPSAKIVLTNDANLSTFLHESGHLWLELIGDIADDLSKMSPDTLSEKQKRIVEDRQTLLDWFGVKSRADIGEAQHEQFARGFEAYIAEGKAPSPELRSIFARFRQWLIAAYRLFKDSSQAAIAERLDVQLSDEVRGVMDRLLASEDEIEQAEKDLGVYQVLDDEKIRTAMGMSEEEYRPFRELGIQTRAAARAELDSKLAKQNARESEKWWKDKRAEVRSQVAAEVYRQKEYRALSNITRGTFPDGTELPADERVGKLDAKAIEQRYGKASRKEGQGSTVANELLAMGAYTRQGGVHPDAAAEFLGYSSGEKLIDALRTAHARPINELIEAETDSRMRTEYGDMLLDGTITEKARQAVMGPGVSELIHAEMKAVRRKQREVAPFVKAAQADEKQRQREGRRILDAIPDVATVRAWAVDRVANTSIRELRPSMYWAAFRKASRLAVEAAAKDQWNNTYNQQLAALRNAELYRASRGALDQVAEAVDEFHSMFVSDKRLEKTHDLDFVNAARAIAATVLGMPIHRADALAYLNRVKDYDPELYETLAGQIETALGSGATYKDMVFEQFQGLRDVVTGLWEMSRRNRQMLIDGKLLEREQVQLELTMRVAEIAKPGRENIGYTKAATAWEKTSIQLMGVRSALRRVESWVDAVDGKANGPFRKYIWNPISDSVGHYRAAKVPVIEKYLELAKGIEKTLTFDKIEAPELGPQGYTFSGKVELLHALLHTGNDSNLQKLLRGRGWGEFGQDGILDTTAWDSFIDRMQASDVLTKADYDFAQGVWDLFESLKPGAQRAHKAMYGAYFKEISFRPVETDFGTYRGGYVPAIVDPLAAPDAANRNDKQLLSESQNSFMFPSTGRGFTKSRIEEYAKPLQLDMRSIPGHLDRVLRFTHIQPAVKDVGRILFDRGFRQTLGILDPTVTGDMLVPWLQRAATQRVSTPSQGWGGKAADAFFRELRKRTGMQIMAANVTNALQQFTGLSISAIKVKPRYLAPALWDYVRGPKQLAATIAEKSDFMKTRTTAQAFEIQKTIDDLLLNPSQYDKLRDFAVKHGYFFQSATQNVVDVITWSGAYSQATADGAHEIDAVRQADAAVRATQGSFAPEDVSRFEVGSAFMRAFTQFYGYFGMQANLYGTELVKITRDMGLRQGAGRALYVYTLGLMIPSVLAELITRGMTGAGLDADDDESYLDDFFSIFFGSQLRTVAAMVPGIGATAIAGINMWNNKRWDDRISTSPAVTAVESAVRAPHSVYKAIAGEGSTKAAVRDALTAIGLLSGLPAGALARPLGYVADVSEGNTEPENAADFARGLVSGR